MIRRLPALLVLLLGTAVADEGDRTMWVFVGTYTGGESEGIYTCELDLQTGELRQVATTGGIENPSFLALHPTGQSLYSVSEVRDKQGRRGAAVVAFRIDESTGKLQELARSSTIGAGPCHVSVDSAGRNVLAANYGGGSAVVIPIAEDGSVQPASDFEQHEGSSVNPQRQGEPHAHCVKLSADDRFAFVSDLGLDKVLIYAFDVEKGTLTPHGSAAVEPGSGPRHFALHPSNKFAYVINELASTVTAFKYDPQAGTLDRSQTLSTLPEGYEGNNSTAEVVVSSDGKFLYGSNRGHNSIAVFAINDSDGSLSAVSHHSTQGEIPRNFNIDPTGRFLLAANQNSGNIAVFRRDAETGKLEFTGNEIKIPKPVCIKFLEK